MLYPLVRGVPIYRHSMPQSTACRKVHTSNPPVSDDSYRGQLQGPRRIAQAGFGPSGSDRPASWVNGPAQGRPSQAGTLDLALSSFRVPCCSPGESIRSILSLAVSADRSRCVGNVRSMFSNVECEGHRGNTRSQVKQCARGPRDISHGDGWGPGVERHGL